MTKAEFLADLEEIIDDEAFLTEKLDALDLEIRNNLWGIGIDFETARQIQWEDLAVFLKKVIAARSQQVQQSDKNMNLLFYLWFDEQAAKLCFNFINANHPQLPFKAQVLYTDDMSSILSDFLQSPYLDGIPWSDLKDQNEEQPSEEKLFQLKVYQELILKN
ncbi:hypothetical protein [Croceimicrobium hydrocarbonivorans]|uniref:Uncharacterized protein n=1 Tax=Croceimicrobium hydrocarbonivorans TaxID=2761580 RepID=A0A7H0VHI3_9FLAO|nr:hypothetical protein [Croceimicrobium hydrocarbonivorans]QNR25181.1 hypothetical protein H4K34_04900 [Croceimicrobium hydrocarbonivorans]